MGMYLTPPNSTLKNDPNDTFCYVWGSEWKSQSCPTLCRPVDCSPPGSSVQGILQAGILEWVATTSSRGSSRPRGQPRPPALPAVLYSLSHQGSPSYVYFTTTKRSKQNKTKYQNKHTIKPKKGLKWSGILLKTSGKGIQVGRRRTWAFTPAEQSHGLLAAITRSIL